jgi:CheY-like chemotaxis protein
VIVTPAARSQIASLREMGFGGYLVKPVRRSSLIERILTRPEPLPAYAPQPAAPAEAQPHRAHETPPAVPATPLRNASLRILLAEDNPINALLTRELLRRRGHTTVEVTSGEAAVKAMLNDSFDVVLTDIHMPGMDGIEATQAIRANETLKGQPRTPIIALTADALETGKRACKEAGMDGFLTKPVDPAQLDEMFAIFFPATAQQKSVAA